MIILICPLSTFLQATLKAYTVTKNFKFIFGNYKAKYICCGSISKKSENEYDEPYANLDNGMIIRFD